MAIRKSTGILGKTDPRTDSDVIVAAAICGYTASRFARGLPVFFDSEGVRTAGTKIKEEKDQIRAAELKKEYVE